MGIIPQPAPSAAGRRLAALLAPLMIKLFSLKEEKAKEAAAGSSSLPPQRGGPVYVSRRLAQTTALERGLGPGRGACRALFAARNLLVAGEPSTNAVFLFASRPRCSSFFCGPSTLSCCRFVACIRRTLCAK